MILAKNLKFLRSESGLTQSELAEKLDLQRTMISAYEDGRSEPKLSTLAILSELFVVSIDELLHHDIQQYGRRLNQNKNIKILTIATDDQDRENITMVGQKASAGYLNGFADPEYMESLPQFHIPTLSRNSTYRAFELSGDSMLPLVPGTVIIGSYVEQLRDIKSGKTYVLVTSTEGVVYKRVFNYLDENGKLFLVSDNEHYKPYEVKGADVLEIWEAKAFISTDFPNPKDKTKPVSLEDISQMILDLRSEIVRLK
ncbi:DNA-binding transcriptional regulator, XRE-family HTH domain [Aquiflexum balticum DSM 16537]|uniref:DNA-binding transcriptional regulator, XRE-family HTH domain n=1 Tax=Aquiflexum balticum DSM 16537 TaxID=758820 RepID=A0A1W2HBC1_9BACT|nr:LexA family transcriptional regulator [Aquiflexum balticum]SMD46091.1 DNA-binding transcriptional regulator, XRE-family HTH domain [Aquiflexum balticum DSM 16537]